MGNKIFIVFILGLLLKKVTHVTSRLPSLSLLNEKKIININRFIEWHAHVIRFIFNNCKKKACLILSCVAKKSTKMYSNIEIFQFRKSVGNLKHVKSP